MAKTELLELESKVKKEFELQSLVKKELVLESLITGQIQDIPNVPPIGTLTLNSIIITAAPGEVLFDFTASDPDGIVAKIELLRKEAAEGSFSEVAEILTPAASGQITDLAVPAGTFEYKLLITDNEGLAVESNIVTNVLITGIIVTFDVGGAKVFIDNEDIPGFTAIMKARKFGSATIEQTAGGKGKITTTTGSDTGYFIGKKDLVLKGTWEMIYEVDISAIGVQMDMFINDGEYSGNGGLEPATYIVGIVVFSDGRVFARFRNTSGILLSIGGQLASYVIGTTGIIIVKMGKTATDYTFDFNGSTKSKLIVDVLAHSEEKPACGECCNGTTVTARFDNFAGID